ncbi:amino acid ABC transporter permease [Geodermatophilus nigrescens]|uniref:Amino acid ABC transporter membrane protein 2, PAAT family n=1 Tax=Geodermatophilus nigrescens TaxID=1070870 RepID=A0A1M5D113_9ACTN|nr:amino acid ABC transporter permease [Geodermatophilus nigrescens]SHF60517.1 amino acid ABC transporter membrane protein 2, PAAT family [Geodermatophilus nigrescens]
MTGLLTSWGEWLPRLLEGLVTSVELTAASLLLGIPLGLVLALLSSSRTRAVRWAAIALVEIGRGTPALVMLQFVYYGLPSAGLSLTAFVSAVAALSLTTAGYTSEILRGGLQAVPAGETEAAGALGMSHRDTLRFVVVPQGVRIALPSLMGFAILIFQATSLTFTISVVELLSQAYSIGAATFRYLDVLVLAGLLYLAVTIPAGLLTNRTERRLSRHL